MNIYNYTPKDKDSIVYDYACYKRNLNYFLLYKAPISMNVNMMQFCNGIMISFTVYMINLYNKEMVQQTTKKETATKIERTT